MRLLPCVFLVALPAVAVPAEHDRDIFSLLTDIDTDTDVPHHTHATINAYTTSLASPSTKPSTSTSPEQWTPRTDPAEPTVIETALVPTPTIQPASADSQPSDHSSKTWQIIGIAIIAVLFVATSITCAMYFDRLWRLLKDVVCCTSRPPVSEHFIPDCEKQTWDARTLSPSPSDVDHYNAQSLHEEPSVYTMRSRELPWNTDSQDPHTLHRQPSRKSDRSSATISF